MMVNNTNQKAFDDDLEGVIDTLIVILDKSTYRNDVLSLVRRRFGMYSSDKKRREDAIEEQKRLGPFVNATREESDNLNRIVEKNKNLRYSPFTKKDDKPIL